MSAVLAAANEAVHMSWPDVVAVGLVLAFVLVGFWLFTRWW